MPEDAVCLLALCAQVAHAPAGILIKVPTSRVHIEAARAHAASPEPANEALGLVPDVTPVRMAVCTVDALAAPSKAACLPTRALSLIHLELELL